MLTGFDLSVYELNRDRELQNLADATEDDYSGIAFNSDTDTIFVIDNGGEGDVYEYSLAGDYMRHIDLDDFDDPEGIVYLGSSEFAILEEGLAEITIVTIGPTTTSVDKQNDGTTIALSHAELNTSTNVGPVRNSLRRR